MANSEYLTSPVPSERMPAGIPYIVGNEAAERFSFYGMKGILVVFMTKYLLDSAGTPDYMSEKDAVFSYHLFTFAAYFLAILGSILSDRFLGKYRTILALSIVYCLGHLALAVDETRLGLAVGLVLIAIGSGGIKPCVSAHVGDQFGPMNQHLLSKVFGWFYFAINLGAFASTLLTPWLLAQERFGPRYAFGIPGVLMLLATIVFWLGRWKFVHVPPGGLVFIREAISGDGLRVTRKILVLTLFVAVFWSLFDQTGSAWVLQAQHMNRQVSFPGLFEKYELLPSQIQAANPALILILIPIFSYGIYPAINRVFPLTALRKISIGFFLTVFAFSVSASIERRIPLEAKVLHKQIVEIETMLEIRRMEHGNLSGQDDPPREEISRNLDELRRKRKDLQPRLPSIGWQFLAYLILTSAEVMVSITALEFSYTQAPRRMKSFIMSLFLLSVAIGNLFTAAVNLYIQNPDGSSKLAGASYYWFFTAVMLVSAIGFVFVARRFQEKTYIQGEE